MTRVTYDGGFDDVEELRKRFKEFRNQYQRRTRLPEELWRAAAEMGVGDHWNVMECTPLCRAFLAQRRGDGVFGVIPGLKRPQFAWLCS